MNSDEEHEKLEQEQRERKISIQENPPSNTEQESTSVEEISKIVENYFPNGQFDNFILDYISNMIFLDHPENENDLKILIGDYLEDQLKYPENKKEEICQKIYKEIYKNKQKNSRRAIIAERLQDPIRLSEIAVGSKNKITSINFDANALTLQTDKLFTQSVTGKEKKKAFVIDKNKKKEDERIYGKS